MASLLDKIKGIRQDEQLKQHQALAKVRDEYLQIAIRDFLDKPKDNDAERLLEVLETLGLSDSDYSQVVNGIGRACSAAGGRQFFDAAMKDHQGRFITAQQEMVASRCMADRWTKTVNDLNRFSSSGGETVKALREVQEQFPALFDEDGKPDAQLQPLINKEAERRKELADQQDWQANQEMVNLIRAKCQTLKIDPPKGFEEQT